MQTKFAAGCLLIGSLLAASCEDDKLVAKALSSAEVCALYIAAQKNSDPNQRCLAPALKDARDLTSAEVERGCRPGTAARAWADGLLAAINEGRLSVDWAHASSCLDKARAVRRNPGAGVTASAQWQALEDGVCKTFFKGLIKEGQPCQSRWDCEAGLGCYTDDPWGQGEQKSGLCQKPGAKGAACGSTHPCDDQTRCVLPEGKERGTCHERLAIGAACESEGDCLSDSCISAGGESKVCGPKPEPQKKLGEVCASSEECLGGAADCIVCRSLVQGAPRTCQPIGVLDDYCLDFNDCALDLGCNSSKCAYTALNEPCGQSPLLQALCSPELTCVPSGECWESLTQMACQSHGERCEWKDGACQHTSGSCLALPTTGACYLGQGCDSKSTYCDEDGSCTPFAKLGETCAPDGKAANLCLGCDPTTGACVDLWCIEDTCKYGCEVNADCNAGEYCGSGPNGQPTCLTAGSICEFNRECRAGEYCNLPLPDCGNIDFVLGGTGWDAWACRNTEGCKMTDFGCTSEKPGTCTPVQTAGAPCDPKGMITQCPSQACSPDDNGVGRCELDLGQGLDDDFVPDMLITVFLFG